MKKTDLTALTKGGGKPIKWAFFRQISNRLQPFHYRIWGHLRPLHRESNDSLLTLAECFKSFLRSPPSGRQHQVPARLQVSSAGRSLPLTCAIAWHQRYSFHRTRCTISKRCIRDAMLTTRIDSATLASVCRVIPIIYSSVNLLSFILRLLP